MQPLQVLSVQMIACSNLSGADATAGLKGLLRSLPDEARTCVIELPCLGIPRLCYTLDSYQVGHWDLQHSIDQWICDYERGENKEISEYSIQQGNVHYVCIHPLALPDERVVQKVHSNQTLMQIPLYLKHALQVQFDYVILLTQGSLMHPMTFFALRSSDAVILYSENMAELMYHKHIRQRLFSFYQMDYERFFIYVPYSKQFKKALTSQHIYTRFSYVWSQLQKLDPQHVVWEHPDSEERLIEQEVPGLMDPILYKDYRFKRWNIERGEFHIDEPKRISLSVSQLTFDDLISSQENPLLNTRDDMYEQVKRHIFQIGKVDSEELRRKCVVRRNRIMSILGLLAEDGVLHRPVSYGKPYTIAWSQQQIQNYYNDTLPKSTVPGTVPALKTIPIATSTPQV